MNDAGPGLVGRDAIRTADDASSPGVGVSYHTCLEFLSVARAASRDDARGAIVDDTVKRQRAMSALVDAIGPSQSVEFECSVLRDSDPEPVVRLQVTCCARASSLEVARELAVSLQANVSAALAAGYPSIRFQAGPPSHSRVEQGSRPSFSVRAVPAGMKVHGRHGMGFRAAGGAVQDLVLPLAATEVYPHLEDALAYLLSAGQSIALRIRFSGCELDDRMVVVLDQLGAVLGTASLSHLSLQLKGRDAVTPMPEEVAAVQSQLRTWSRHRSGVEVRVTLHSENPIPDALARLLLAEPMQGRPFELRSQDEHNPAARAQHDLRDFLFDRAAIPPTLPSATAIVQAGLPQHHTGPRPAVRGDGPVLGQACSIHGPELIRLDSAGTIGHEYIVGSTGTGKSELMRKLISEDVAAGRSLALLCPKGDLYRDVIADLPDDRLDDLIPLDFADHERVPGLNPLELGEGRTELERNRVVGIMVELTEKMNRGVPESVGPMYRMYARHGLTLLMSALKNRATLADFPRLFTDRHFFQFLIDRCDDPRTVDFWNQLAKQADGDAALKNMALYVVNKFTEFSDNAKVSEITGQASSTVNFSACLDKPGTILAVNLAKGLIGDTNTRLLGSLLLSKLSTAAASRAGRARSARVPFRIYVDEFPNFISLSGTLQEMLAESRKYGISLTLAHQSLDQLGSAVASTVLANAPTKYFFRLGAPDAREIAPYIHPHFGAQDVATLPNHHAVACLAPGGAPQPPVVVRIHPNRRPEADSGALETSGKIGAALARVARPVGEVRQELKDARLAHLYELKVSSIVGTRDSLALLREQGITTLTDLARRQPEEREQILKAIGELPSKAPGQTVDEVRLRSMLGKLLSA